MVQSHVMNVLPRGLIAHLWDSQATRISLSHLTSKQSTVTTPSFLSSELPIRYTHILRLLSSLDTETLQAPLIRNVTQRYLQDICSLLHPSLRQTSPRAYSQTIYRLKQRQATSMICLRYALAPHSLKLLDHINAINVGIHYLLDQHVSWHDQTGNHAQSICPVGIAQQAAKDAQKVCNDMFGETPTITIKKSTHQHYPLEITQVPSILHRMLYEPILLTLASHSMQRKSRLEIDIFGGPTSVGFRITHPKVYSLASGVSDGVWSGWRMAQTLASHFGGHLDVVLVKGLGSTVYLTLDRDPHLLERYPHAASSRLPPSAQLDAFLHAVADYSTPHHITHPATHHHAVSLTAAVGHA
ncbi:hypothetical protein BC941DRAFT_500858 [Chlamydoabsidia padenii]|nr:hypothetical protein BC941DRAFT_500858 [Chlamydoabsidia padenii]